MKHPHEVDDAARVAPLVSNTYEGFRDSLREVGTAGDLISAERFCRALHIDLETLAEQAQAHRNTVSHSPAAHDIQDLLREALQVIQAATDVAGDVNRAIAWYRNEPINVFDFKTPEQLVLERRSDKLLRYVLSLEAGASG